MVIWCRSKGGLFHKSTFTCDHYIPPLQAAQALLLHEDAQKETWQAKHPRVGGRGEDGSHGDEERELLRAVAPVLIYLWSRIILSVTALAEA